MPIQLNYTDADSGINLPTSYWFIITLSMDRVANTCKFLLGGYATLAAKQAGKNPLRYKEIVTTMAALSIAGTSTVNQFVNSMELAAIADPFFATAIQV